MSRFQLIRHGLIEIACESQRQFVSSIRFSMLQTSRLFSCGTRRSRVARASRNGSQGVFAAKDKLERKSFHRRSKQEAELSSLHNEKNPRDELGVLSASSTQAETLDLRSSHEIQRARKNISTLLDSFQLSYERVKFDWAQMNRELVSLRDCQILLLDAMKGEAATLPARTQDSLQSLRASLSVTDSAKDAAGSAQEKLDQMCQDFAQTASAILGPYMPERSRSPSIQSSTPPLLRDYFEQWGAVDNQRELLDEIDFEHQREAEEREFLKDQDRSLELSDRQFDVEYEQQRKRAELQLSESIKLMELLRSKCLQMGLDIRPQRGRPSSSRFGDDANSETVPWQGPRTAPGLKHAIEQDGQDQMLMRASHWIDAQAADSTMDTGREPSD